MKCQEKFSIRQNILFFALLTADGKSSMIGAVMNMDELFMREALALAREAGCGDARFM